MCVSLSVNTGRWQVSSGCAWSDFGRNRYLARPPVRRSCKSTFPIREKGLPSMSPCMFFALNSISYLVKQRGFWRLQRVSFKCFWKFVCGGHVIDMTTSAPVRVLEAFWGFLCMLYIQLDQLSWFLNGFWDFELLWTGGWHDNKWAFIGARNLRCRPQQVLLALLFQTRRFDDVVVETHLKTLTDQVLGFRVLKVWACLHPHIPVLWEDDNAT